MRRNKRGQASAAAALIAIIAALIVLYILFIPPSERAKILEGDGLNGETGIGVSVVEENETLLLESPGRIDFLSQKTVDHAVPTTHVFTRTEGLVLEKKASLYIKKSLFSSKQENVSFRISDLVNTENILLSGVVKEGQGRLMIFLNENEIYNSEVRGNIPAIELPRRLLKTDNTLLFKVSSPGAAFWRTNEYSLENVQVAADVTSIEAQSSRSLFLVSATEKNNLDRVALKFEPDCTRDSGRLDVYINEYNIYSAVPDCGGGRLKLEFSPAYLRIGENELIFRIGSGDYYLDHIAIQSELKTIDFPVYYFELSDEEFTDVEEGDSQVVLRLSFIDYIEEKRGEIILNGHLSGFDTKELSWETDVSDDIVRGNNGVQIRPRKTLDIRELEVILAPSE
ncbi:MAG: hypothetical protein KAT77_02355 [Nanoarchaeota archaeon]|nr:hypothetical protein [Nanoarchaeota archaeon]